MKTDFQIGMPEDGVVDIVMRTTMTTQEFISYGLRDRRCSSWQIAGPALRSAAAVHAGGVAVMSRCPTCTGRRQPDHLMCPTCWSNVPRALQRAVHKAWVLAFGPRFAHLRTRQHLADYVKARDAAIESVRAGGIAA